MATKNASVNYGVETEPKPNKKVSLEKKNIVPNKHRYTNKMVAV